MIKATYNISSKKWTVYLQHVGTGRTYRKIGKASLLRLTRIALEYGHTIEIY